MKDHPNTITRRIYRRLPLRVKKLIKNKHFRVFCFVLIIFFFFVLGPKIISTYCEDTINGINNIFQIDLNYKYLENLHLSNKWCELFISLRQQVIQEFNPCIVRIDDGCIDRDLYGFESSRLLGVNPYKHEFIKKSHALIIGDSTSIGSSIIDYYENELDDLNYVHIGCDESFPINSDSIKNIINYINISSIFVTCPRTDYKLISTSFPNANKVFAVEANYLDIQSLDYQDLYESDFNVFIFNGSLLSDNNEVKTSLEKNTNLKSKMKFDFNEKDFITDISSTQFVQHVFTKLDSKNKKHKNSLAKELVFGSNMMMFKDFFDVIDANGKEIIVTTHSTSDERHNLNLNSKFTQVNLKGEKKQPLKYLKNINKQLKSQHSTKSSYKNSDTIFKYFKRDPYISVIVPVITHDDQTNLHPFLKLWSQGISYFSDFEMVIPTNENENYENILKIIKEFPELSGHVKIVKIPDQLLSKFSNNQYLSVFYNVAIARSSGNFVLFTSTNTIFNEEFFKSRFLKYSDLNYGVLYLMLNDPNSENQFHSIKSYNHNDFNVKGVRTFALISKYLIDGANGLYEGMNDSEIDTNLISKLYTMVNGFSCSYLQMNGKIWFEGTDINLNDSILQDFACEGKSKHISKEHNPRYYGFKKQKLEEFFI